MRRSRSMPSFAIAGHEVAPGSRLRVELDLAPLYVGARMILPVWVLHGARPGPVLWVSACIHGDEVLGAHAIREVLERVAPEDLCGTLLALPAVNLYGMIQQTRYLPDRRDLNRSFPGSSKGSLTARLAKGFMKLVVARATHGIDLHTAAVHRSNLPQVRANLDHDETRGMALAFGAEVAIHATERDGSLRQAASVKGVPTLLYEGGEALRHDPMAAAAATRGVLAVMAHLGMRTAAERVRPTPAIARRSSWLRAEDSGYLVLEARLGDRVKAGEELGVLHVKLGADGKGGRIPLRAPAGGIVIGRLENPLVTVGDALVHVAPLEPARRRPAARGEA